MTWLGRSRLMNKNGKNDLAVLVFVDPVNDSPFIQVPGYIVLMSDADESQILDRETNKFDFSIGEPGAFNYPVTFSMEVNDGLLVTSIPAELINSTELKLKTSFQWEPLQTYVTISKHFTIKASVVRFYQSGEGHDVLKAKLNDMGHYGCRPDCTEKISLPLFAEATLPKSAVPDPYNFELWLKVDREIRQQGSTKDMIFKIPYLISHISSIMTLFEGDVILTGIAVHFPSNKNTNTLCSPQGVGPVKAGQKTTAGIAGLLVVRFDNKKRRRPGSA
ncbi:hypothetical protein KPL70_002008 [Citrus sinensis]|nr:hypothetical protein KPL70_002008 [Citrus sinensis]